MLKTYRSLGMGLTNGRNYTLHLLIAIRAAWDIMGLMLDWAGLSFTTAGCWRNISGIRTGAVHVAEATRRVVRPRPKPGQRAAPQVI